MSTRRAVLKAGLALAPAALFPQAVLAGDRVVGGTFVGKSNHITTGSVTVETSGQGSVIRLGADFSFDGAPDPKVALGNNGYDASTLLGPLVKNTGAQDYAIPASIDASRYNEVWIWCERFNVPLGVASLR